MPPSRIGTIDPADYSKNRVVVDADLNPVGAGSGEAAFVFKRSDLDRLQARREELGLNDEPARVQAASHKAALADAERRAAAAEADVAVLKERVAASEKAEKASAKKAEA